jgi:hypothetical protein
MNERGNILLAVADASFTPVYAGSLIPRISPTYKLGDE